jgi:lipoprotein-anchoring transpeptidase ErfK/SrfK
VHPDLTGVPHLVTTAGRQLLAAATAAVGLLLATPIAHAAAAGWPDLRGCPARPALTTCVDLSAQRLWVRDGRRIIFGPVPVRTGRPGYATPDGWFTIDYRNKYQWSAPFNVPMPFSQFFDGSDALHGVFGPISGGPGSHGCVNLLYNDAATLWHTIGISTHVYIWGTKPRQR